MAGKTPNYGLAFFDFRDRLDSTLSVKMETDRFLTIDKQLYGLYSIFGSGVVDGLRARKSASDSTSIEVDPGLAFVNLLSGELRVPKRIEDLPPSSTVYLFCTVTGSTQKNRRLHFFTSTAPSQPNSIRLSKIQTIGSEVRIVDNTYREEISFRKTVQEEIASHRHRGFPSKIDLSREVKNQLPGARVEGLDVRQIRSGRFGLDRIPQLSHDNLKGKGLLSHSALDSMAKNLQISNRQLLGEVASVNLLRQHLFDKTLSEEYLNSSVNTISIIPGKTPENYIDFDASTVSFTDSGDYEGCPNGGFTGKASPPGKIFNVKYDDDHSFNAAYRKENIVISQNSVTLLSGAEFNDPVEYFEQADSDGEEYPGVSISENIILNNISVVSDATVYVQGLYSGKFSSGKSSQIVYKKTITQNNDWYNYELLSVKVNCLSSSHPPVSFAFAHLGSDGEEVLSEKFPLLQSNEVTQNDDSSQNNFKQVSVDISSFDRSNVIAIYFYVSDSYKNFSFNIDEIGLATEAKYVSSGMMSFRYSSGSIVTLNTIFYDANTDGDTEVNVRYRSGNSLVDLGQAEWGPNVTSGSDLYISGTEFEVEVSMKASDDLEFAPILNSVTLQFFVSGDDVGFSVSDLDDFLLGEMENIQIGNNFSGDSTYISISLPVEVDDMYYSQLNSVSQVSDDFSATYGYGGSGMLISPIQAINYNQSDPLLGFDGITSVKRLVNKNYLICDTYNDRVLEIDRNYKLVRGYGSHYVGSGAGFFPLSAVYNPRTGIIQICLSQEAQIDPETFNLTGITIHVGENILNLSSRDELLQRNLTRRIMEIRLSSDKQQEISIDTQNVHVEMSPSSFFIEDFDHTSSFDALYGYKGLKVDVVDFTYIDGITHPVCVTDSELFDRWYVANSGVPFDRIRAGLRDDSDEFFTSPGKELLFNLVVSLSDSLKDQGAVVTFMNDSGVSDNIPVSVSPPFSSFIDVKTVSNTRATVETTASDEDIANGPTYLLTFTIKVEALDEDDNLVEINESPFLIQKRITVVESTAEEPTYPDIPSLIRLNLESDSIDFSFGGVDKFTFNDFTLGSVVEMDADRLLVSGIQPFGEGTEPPINPDPDSFEGQASEMLKDFRGKTIILSVSSENIFFNYDSSDGLYASDASFDDNSNIILAESSIVKNVGRIIKLDSFGNIVAVFGNGQFTIINDVRSSKNGNILIST
ncbi:hypothetical protein CMI47_11585 [Candidatus Pacearchaeota archaeon]|jgi:hypothetical protein|nr:hypothetical protein [Candidatus Pacearchaeota archaeon]